MPIEGVAMVDWVPLIALPFVAATLLVARTAGLTMPEIGARLPADLGLPVLAVAAWAVGGFVVSRLGGEAVAWGTTSSGVDWVRVVVYGLLIAVAEELAFRGVLPAALDRLVPRDGMWVATMAPSQPGHGLAVVVADHPRRRRRQRRAGCPDAIAGPGGSRATRCSWSR
jgi:membrane protease YdiL (CAAX protease family)